MDYQANSRGNDIDFSQREWVCRCTLRLIYLFAIFFAFSLGLILGAVFAAVLLPALPAIIVFAAVMAILILALAVYRYCLCCRSRRCD